MLPSWTPDLTSLDLLLSVAETGSVGRAAAVHQISQPSASARLSRLERQLGVTVLVRRTTGSTLTPAGEAVVAWAARVVAAARTLNDGVLTLRGTANARLRVAASLTVAEYLMAPWLLALRARHSDLDVAAMVHNSREVAEHVRTGQADIGFVESPDLPAGVTGQHVGTDRLAFVVSAKHPLATPRQLAVTELPDLPLLLREPGSGTRDTFLRALAEALSLSTSPALPTRSPSARRPRSSPPPEAAAEWESSAPGPSPVTSPAAPWSSSSYATLLPSGHLPRSGSVAFPRLWRKS